MSVLSSKQLLTVRQIADAVGQDIRNVRHLLKVTHKRLVDAGKRGILTEVPGRGPTKTSYVVTVADLREHFPLWLRGSGEVPEAVKNVREDMEDTRRSMTIRVNAMGARIRDLTKVVNALTKRVDILTRDANRARR